MEYNSDKYKVIHFVKLNQTGHTRCMTEPWDVLVNRSDWDTSTCFPQNIIRDRLDGEEGTGTFAFIGQGVNYKDWSCYSCTKC